MIVPMNVRMMLVFLHLNGRNRKLAFQFIGLPIHPDEDDGGNHNAECTTNDVASQSICKKCDVEVLDGQLAIMCDMCYIWFHEECSGLSKKQLNVIGEIDACKLFCGWSLDNVDDRLKCVSNNLGMKKDIEDIKR